jgi:hypothetical protein
LEASLATATKLEASLATSRTTTETKCKILISVRVGNVIIQTRGSLKRNDLVGPSRPLFGNPRVSACWRSLRLATTTINPFFASDFSVQHLEEFKK